MKSFMKVFDKEHMNVIEFDMNEIDITLVENYG